MGQCSAHGSAPVDDDNDDSSVEKMSPVKAKKPSKPDEFEEETQEHRPIGRDCSKAKKKKSSASSREGSSLFVDLVADKFFNIKLTKWGKMKEQQDSYIQLKNQELDIQEEKQRN
nr:hypothetical protein [Tanacetum cinerariifolium]